MSPPKCPVTETARPNRPDRKVVYPTEHFSDNAFNFRVIFLQFHEAPTLVAFNMFQTVYKCTLCEQSL